MTGIGSSNELRAYTRSEWKGDVGYLVKEFEKRNEAEKAKKKADAEANPKTSVIFRFQLVDWILGKRHYGH
jgi:hypothetical protein